MSVDTVVRPAAAAPDAAPTSPVARVLLAAIGLYRAAISPLRPPVCRYTPSCSAYAVEAITVHGAARGTWLAVRRLLRCHPFHRGGHDPVPPRVSPGTAAGAAVPTPTIRREPGSPTTATAAEE